MSFLMDALTAVFGKPKYESGGVTVFSPEERAQHTAMIEDIKEDYHWRGKDTCTACDKRRVTMVLPQFEDFGYREALHICANCAKEMYDISRYMFNGYVKEFDIFDDKEQLPW
tara:strand:+ start:2748 stop:3086 length:339 start_codon:yes stop_codon:yes gene_type:complete